MLQSICNKTFVHLSAALSSIDRTVFLGRRIILNELCLMIIMWQYMVNCIVIFAIISVILDQFRTRNDYILTNLQNLLVNISLVKLNNHRFVIFMS